MSNAKREKKRDKRLDNLTPFTSTRQPDPKLKKEWRNRRREAQRIMDKLKEFGTMSLVELEAYMKENQKTMKLEDAIILKYAQDVFKDKRMAIDYLNRHVSYAPTKQELTGEDWWPIQQKIIKIWSKK